MFTMTWVKSDIKIQYHADAEMFGFYIEISFLTQKVDAFWKQAWHMKNSGLLNYSPVSPILSHPVTQISSTDFHLGAETCAKLYSVWLSGKMRGSCLRIRLAQKYLCSSPLLPLSTQVQPQTPGLVKTHGFSFVGVDTRMGSLCSASA